ncbi:MAG: FAD-dependent oxidoreductase [Sumerlaeia bacterium]
MDALTPLTPGQRCLIVGAGMAGLAAARVLHDAGIEVVILEKSRGVGGRMATRRLGDPPARVDTGAQYISAKSPEFQALIDECLAAGAAKVWTIGIPDDHGGRKNSHPRYVGADGMTAIPKHMAHGLEIHYEERLAKAAVDGDRWAVKTETGARFTANAMILTPPVPQALDIAAQGTVPLDPEAQAILSRVTYDPCIATLLLLDQPSVLPDPGGMTILETEPIVWVADAFKKGISERPCLLVHAGPRWSRDNFDDNDAHIVRLMTEVCRPYLGEANVTASQVRRWKFSVPQNRPSVPMLVGHAEPPLLFAGDAFGGAKVEGAFLSGLAAARALLGQ